MALVLWDTSAAYQRHMLEQKPLAFAEIPEEQRKLHLELAELLVANPGVAPPQLHVEWCKRMMALGWTHGPALNVQKKEHPAMCHWRALSDEDRRKVSLIIAVTQSLTGFV